MIKVPLEELPRWSPWPARLLGLAPWSAPTRDRSKVIAEYDGEKYARCLEHLNEHAGAIDPDELKRFELGGSTEPVCVWCDGGLHALPIWEARERQSTWLRKVLRPIVEGARSAIELGCGYGYNLAQLRRVAPELSLWGGELSSNAVAIASRLHAADDALTVERFDFLGDSYSVLERAPAPAVLFTVHALEQLPSARPFFERLLPHRERIAAVVHFEPAYELHGEEMLGLLRRRYAEANDYNRDLMSELERLGSEIKLERVEPDAFGLQPLNPASLVVWRFC